MSKPVVRPMDVELQDIPEEEPQSRKVIRAILSIFLILLMLSFLIPNDIVGSIIESNKVVNYVVTYKNITITFDKNTYESIKSVYLNNQLTETPFCLTGNITNNSYNVDSFYIPRTFFKTPITVSSQICSENTIIDMHTHPFKDCLLSQQDISAYNYYKEINSKAIMAVMCDVDTFAFYKN